MVVFPLRLAFLVLTQIGKRSGEVAEAYGRDAVDAMIAALQTRFPGFVVRLVGPVDAHHSQARFTWGLGPAGDEPVIVGFDVAVAGEDGRLTSVLGFLDKVPA